jgi:sRNA-binding carbon storage regulator CsrA
LHVTHWIFCYIANRESQEAKKMLHIQMYKGEFFTIGENIKVYCSKSGVGDSVTLSIEAPQDLKILRPKHVESELRILASTGDTEARKTLKKLDTAREEREATQSKRKLQSEQRKLQRQAG